MADFVLKTLTRDSFIVEFDEVEYIVDALITNWPEYGYDYTLQLLED